MNHSARDIIFLIRETELDSIVFEKEMGNLHQIFARTETISQFCRVHELVNRNTITSKRTRLMKFPHEDQHKPFRFLINKN